jgi:hypothetical protein
MVSASTKYMDKKSRELRLQFEKKLTGRSEYQARWKECISEVLATRAEKWSAAYLR